MKLNFGSITFLILLSLNSALFFLSFATPKENLFLSSGNRMRDLNKSGERRGLREREKKELKEKYLSSKRGKRVMAVQMKFYKRSPVHNRQFELFHIDEKEYRLRNLSEKRDCEGNCAHVDHLVLLKLMSKFEYDFYLILEDDIFFCSDLATIEHLMLLNNFVDILTTGHGGGGLVLTRKGLHLSLNMKKPPFDLKKAGWGS